MGIRGLGIHDLVIVNNKPRNKNLGERVIQETFSVQNDDGFGMSWWDAQSFFNELTSVEGYLEAKKVYHGVHAERIQRELKSYHERYG